MISFWEIILADKNIAVDQLSFEESLKELEEIVDNLEGGEGSLEDAIKAYERGSKLKQHCQKKLDEARMKVEKIQMPDGTGSAEASEFEN